MVSASLLALLLQGTSLGLTAAVSPGSFQAYLIGQSLSSGWRRGLIVALAPLISDPPIILAMLFLLHRLPPVFLSVISVAGGLFALYLARGLWREWRAAPAGSEQLKPAAGAAAASPFGILRKAAFMNLLSPGPYTFWALVCGPILLSALRSSWLAGAAFLAGFYGLFILGNVSVAIIFHQTRRLGNKVVRVLLLFSILILAGFGSWLIYSGFV